MHHKDCYLRTELRPSVIQYYISINGMIKITARHIDDICIAFKSKIITN